MNHRHVSQNLRAWIYKNEDTCVCGCFLLMTGRPVDGNDTEKVGGGRQKSEKVGGGRQKSEKVGGGRQKSEKVGEREAKKRLESENVR